jgi:ParB family chromosome partitioning protein
VAAIQPNPYQPRKVGDVATLVESVRKLGVVMPLVVMPADAPAQYCLIAGARRLEAARLAGLQTVPAIVRTAAELERMEQDLVEAARRTDLNPLVLANLYERLNADLSLAYGDIASLVGRSTSSVSETLRLLKLSDKVKVALSQGRITYEHARNLLWLSTPQAQNIALQHILDRGMSAAQTELFVRNSLGGQAIAASGEAEYAPETIHTEERLVGEFMAPCEEDPEPQGEERPGSALVARTRALLMSNRVVQPTNVA